MYTGHACGSSREKAFNKILSSFSQCVSRGMVVTKWHGMRKVPRSIRGKTRFFFFSPFLFFFFFFTFSLPFSYCSFVLFLVYLYTVAQVFSIYKFSSLLPDFPFNLLVLVLSTSLSFTRSSDSCISSIIVIIINNSYQK